MTTVRSWNHDSHNILEQATGLKLYNKWLISLFINHFGKNILEIGSGLGGLSALLPKSNITLSDSSDEYVELLRKDFSYPAIKLNIEKGSPSNLYNKYDTIFTSNVFEHIKDDQRAFINAYKLLKKNGKLLIFVPARPEIYGVLDKDMGHFRRYTKEEGIKKAKKAGFKIIKAKYTNLPGYFAWWGRGKLLGGILKNKSGSTRTDYLLAKVYDYLIVPFLWLEKIYTPPVGQSLMMVLEKTK